LLQMIAVESCCVVLTVTTSMLVTLNMSFVTLMLISQVADTLRLRYILSYTDKCICCRMIFSSFIRVSYCLYATVLFTIGIVHGDMSNSYRSVDWVGLQSCLV